MSTNESLRNNETFFTEKVNKLKFFYTTSNSQIIVHHSGEFSHDKINTISSIVENQLEQLGTSKKTLKKIFSIVIEMLQNISIHGVEDKLKFYNNYFFLAKKGNEYTIHSGNLVDSAQAEKLNKRLNAIKSLNETDLKKEYIEVLKNGELSAKGGAGLGFLTIALKSENKIDFDFEDINKEYTLFSLHSKVTD